VFEVQLDGALQLIDTVAGSLAVARYRPERSRVGPGARSVSE